ncbi:MAG: hypothetical protein RL497_3178 [Pseudomonadota bacterium]|jgi:hypothetical protein
MNHPPPNRAVASGLVCSSVVLLVSILSGCSVLPTLGAASSSHSVLHPQRSLHELLAQRLALCGQEKTLRAEQIRGLRSQIFIFRKDAVGYAQKEGVGYSQKEAVAALEEKLDGLMLASCEPANTPGLMGEVLNHLVNLGEWPAEYAALFDLLRSEQRAINQLSARAQESARENAELRQTLQTQKDEFSKLQGSYKETIKGIGEIEETLDSRKQKPQSPP